MKSEYTDKATLSPGEFAAIFGKSQTWGYRQLYAGKVKALTGYGRIQIPATEVDRLLSEAGRYLGLSSSVEKIASAHPKPRKERVTLPNKNKWKGALQARRKKPGRKLRDKNAKRANQQMSATRASALRKLNQR